MQNSQKKVSQDRIAAIGRIFKSTAFKPVKLLKGGNDYSAPFGIKHHNYQKDFDSKTVLYEGSFQNKDSIMKIYLNPEKELDHFKRELYIYTKIRESAPVWKKISADLFSYDRQPLPFLILEKLVGSPWGDWFHIKHDEVKPLEELLTILPLVYQQTKLPKEYAYASYDQLPFFLERTKKITRTLGFVDQTKAVFFWRAYLDLGRRLEKQWAASPNTFIFSDLNPANIFLLDKGGLRIIDFDAVSLGKKTYDYAFLYYASIGSRLQKFLFEKISRRFFQTKEKEFFLLFFTYFCLTHSWSFVVNEDLVKFNKVIKELGRLLVLEYKYD